jgi:hypothetical protein
VPEWGEPAVIDEAGNESLPAKPLAIFYRMVTLDDLALVNEFDGDQWHKQAARIVALKSLDEDGKRLFKTIDAVTLRETAAPDVVNRIAVSMLGRLTVEEAAKN